MAILNCWKISPILLWCRCAFLGVTPAVVALTVLTILAPTLAGQVSRRNLSNGSLRSIGSLAELTQPFAAQVVLRGVVTFAHDTGLFVQDQTGAIEVLQSTPLPLAIGDEVEITGDYNLGDHRPMIRNAVARRLWSGSEPVPLELTPEQAAEGNYLSYLVTVEGKLLQKQISGTQLSFVLEGDNQIFTVSVDISSPSAERLSSEFVEGSTLRAKGICSLSSWKNDPSSVTFTMLLRSFDDLRTVSPAPWWNMAHTVSVVLGAITVLLCIYRFHVYNLHLRFEAVMNERMRFAREMHDTLAQSFSGLSLILEDLLNEMNAAPPSAAMHHKLELALKTVQHSRKEAYGSIFALRALPAQNVSLMEILMAAAKVNGAGDGIKIVEHQIGIPSDLQSDTQHNLIRIAEGAIANAIRHAEASKVELILDYSSTEVSLSICDDGKGFEVDKAPSVDLGHFGLTVMRERASRMGGWLSVTSSLDGTTVTVRVPCEKRMGTFRRMVMRYPGTSGLDK
jgi:hypothetical protein